PQIMMFSGGNGKTSGFKEMFLVAAIPIRNCLGKSKIILRILDLSMGLIAMLFLF
ncbi:unnamed protein product, partial [marine sediment metagenome]